jgi:LmbE family N-acetylglucosaminyl deacetylase
MEDWHVPSQPGTPPPATRVLAFAPHPDDEVFGAGGVLALYAAAGAAVRVVIVTDGAAQVEPAGRESYAAARMAESHAALACLAVHDLQCWGLADRGLAADGTLPERIAHAIAEWPAEVVLAPSLWEIHPDHVALGRAVLGAVRVTEPTPDVLLYEVGGAQRLNLLVDLAPVWAAKVQAMSCFGTQQSRQNYARHIEALNVWRTYTLPPEVRHAEAFTHLRPADLRADAVTDDPLAWFERWMADETLARASASQESLRAQLQARDAGLEALRQHLALREETLVAEIARHATDLGALRQHLALREETLVAEIARHAADQEALRQHLALREETLVAEIARHAADLEETRTATAAREGWFAETLATRDAALNAERTESASLRAQLGDAEQAGDRLRSALLAMERSTSWRFTAPMRLLMSRLRGR